MRRKHESELPVLPSAQPRFADTPAGNRRSTGNAQQFIRTLRSSADQPPRSPIDHWLHILETATPGSISERYAKEAIATLEQKRNPNNA